LRGKSRIWLAIMLLALGAAAYISIQRIRMEAALKEVAVAVDFCQVQKMASWEGVSLEEVLERLRGAGANCVLFKEQTCEDLEQEVGILSGPEVLPYVSSPQEAEPGYTYILVKDPQLFSRIKGQLEVKVPGTREISAKGGFLLKVPLSPRDLKEVGLGFPQREMDLACQKGFLLLPQIRAWYKVSPASLETVFNPLQVYQQDMAALIFYDKFIPGYPDKLSLLAGELKRLDVPLGIIEFFPQKGLAQAVRWLEGRAVRIHSIGEGEVTKLSPREALERLELAARERNMGILIVRFNLHADSPHWLGSSASFLEDLNKLLQADGLRLGKPSAFPPFPFYRGLVLLVGLGVIAGGLALLDKMGLSRIGWILGLLALLFWSYSLASCHHLDWSRKLMALGAAVIFPSLALMSVLSPNPRSLLQSIGGLLKATGISLLGGLFIASLLAGNFFFLKLDQFMGVKVAFVLPLLLFGLAAVFRAEGERGWEVIKRWGCRPLTLNHVLIAVLLGTVFFLYLNRSGNESIGLLPLEGAMRSWLGNLLLARPRTKEFLIGYPFLLLSLRLGYQHKYLILWMLGLIGQISLVNTFCHLHIPLTISLLRSFNGLWLGLLLGCLLLKVVERLYLKKGEPR